MKITETIMKNLYDDLGAIFKIGEFTDEICLEKTGLTLRELKKEIDSNDDLSEIYVIRIYKKDNKDCALLGKVLGPSTRGTRKRFKHIIGMDFEEANSEVKKENCFLNIVKENGVPKTIEYLWIQGRINVSVDEGKVTKIESTG